MIALLTTSISLNVGATDSAVGHWKTIDDKTGKVKSIVEISQTANDNLSGKILRVLQSERPHPICSKCEGERHNQPIEGMTILWDLKPDGTNRWSGGTILDPANGKTYRSKIALQPGGDKLDVSGCIAFICRTQTWIRE
ncbi:MAG: DUF2147 domain-containing protein [Xanthomonadaceae bacterium]|nr:DUF2147 domain-containing protein [Xanthomonadaceae bacterium]